MLSPLRNTHLRLIFLLFSMFVWFVVLPVKAEATTMNDLDELTEENLDDYVLALSHDFYQQQQLLTDYFHLYQEKRDPRGFNVWYLKGFMPVFTELKSVHEAYAETNAALLQNHPESNLLESIYALEIIASRLMTAVRENDPAIYKMAHDLNQEHSEKIATALSRHGLDNHVKTITFK